LGHSGQERNTCICYNRPIPFSLLSFADLPLKQNSRGAKNSTKQGPF